MYTLIAKRNSVVLPMSAFSLKTLGENNIFLSLENSLASPPPGITMTVNGSYLFAVFNVDSLIGTT